MRTTEKKYQCIPFWSWNDELDEEQLQKQVEWMNENGVGGFFMHARGGLKTEYLGKKWFDCIRACSEKAKELGMEAYAYDENGWPSGFVGGKLLENIENRDKYLTHTIGAYDPSATVSYDLTGACLRRTTCGENCLNVYEHYSASTADILNGEVVDQFIAQTHEEYKKRDTYELKGFFTDEPQYYRWGTPFTRVLPRYFKEHYGEDIYDGLGLLFEKKEGYREFRYKYWKAMQDLMLTNYAKKVYEWCDSNGYKLTGHYVEEGSMAAQMWCCGGIMPFYEYEHIPGVDWLGRYIGSELTAKQVGSVAAQLGKKQVLTETYACCGWDVTPTELKRIAEVQYVNGVNLMCQHLLPFTEHGQRKRDYPAHFSAVNPWVNKGFKDFNDYFSVLGKLLSESEELVNVAMVHPIRSTYFDYQRDGCDNGGEVVAALDKALIALVEKIGAMQIPHHYLDETLLAKYGRVEGNKLCLGKCAYEYLILPKLYTMDATTENLLHAFVNAGGKVLLADEKPRYVEWREYDYPYLHTNVTWEEIVAAQPYSIANAEGLRSTLRRDMDGKAFIYVVNFGAETTAEFRLQKGKSFIAYDILKDEYTPLSTRVRFDEGQSYVLYISEDVAPAEKAASQTIRLGEGFDIAHPVDNYLTLDYIRYSTDGVHYSEPVHHMGVFNEMLQRRYRGRLFLRYEAEIAALPTVCELLAEDTNTRRVCVNGKEVQSCGSSALERALLRYDVAGLLKIGKNEFEMEIDYFQSEQVYYALFGENVTEGLKNCLAYDTDIEAVMLKGNFGVRGEFEKGNADNILLGKNFVVDKQKTHVVSLIEDGFPFFSGNITLKQKITVERTDCELVTDKRFHLLDVTVNGVRAGRLLFGRRMDLSPYLHVGENEIEIVLTVGNRNLLGPFHTLEQENFAVGPYTFERIGTWSNGKSSLMRDESYAFVKTLV